MVKLGLIFQNWCETLALLYLHRNLLASTDSPVGHIATSNRASHAIQQSTAPDRSSMTISMGGRLVTPCSLQYESG